MSDNTTRQGPPTEEQDTIDAVSEIANEQIRPENPNYLDGIGEFERAVDIGRRVIKRNRAGGRPSKVKEGISRVETVLEWYGGDQRRMLLKNEVRDIRANMSRPTWKKFSEKANELIADELDEPLDVTKITGPADTY